MAARKDYGPKAGGRSASRAEPKRTANKGNRRAAAPPPPPPPVRTSAPWLKIVVALAMLGGMAWLLYSLTQIGSSTTPVKKPASVSQPAAKPQPKAATKTAAKATAEAPAGDEERFEFYNMLPKSEVKTEQVDVYKSTPKDAKMQYRYLLQAGSFRKAADAERMRAKLILMGMPNAHTSKSNGQNGTWYRVRVGPFDNRSLLNRAQDKLVRQRIQPMEIKLK